RGLPSWMPIGPPGGESRGRGYAVPRYRRSGAGGPVEQAAILRPTVARPEDGHCRECSHRPAAQQGEDDLAGARRGGAGELRVERAGTADGGDAAGEQRVADALDPPGEWRQQSDGLDG